MVAPRDRLWVREAGLWCDIGFERSVAYRADGEPGETWVRPIRWRSPLYMPRWASRLTLEIVGVRVGRLQEISEEDAKAEGCAIAGGWPESREWFRVAWNHINGKKHLWESNPWVWVVEFKRLRQENVT